MSPDRARQATRSERPSASQLSPDSAPLSPDGLGEARPEDGRQPSWPVPLEPERRSLHRSQSARSLLLTVLGEYVLPRDGTVWTSTLLEALALFGVEDKAARQALARAAKAGWLASERVGREARWHLTGRGRILLAEGSARIYAFDPTRQDWDGKWLVLVISIPEERRADRHVLRTRLAWAGFGSLGQGVWLSPDTGRQAVVRSIFEGFERPSRLVCFVAELGELGDAGGVVQDAWDLVELERRYRAFITEFAAAAELDPALAFTVNTRIVHEWRKFPFTDPGLPTTLLPPGWPGQPAHALFQQLHNDLVAKAGSWFDEAERQAALRHEQRGSRPSR